MCLTLCGLQNQVNGLKALKLGVEAQLPRQTDADSLVGGGRWRWGARSRGADRTCGGGETDNTERGCRCVGEGEIWRSDGLSIAVEGMRDKKRAAGMRPSACASIRPAGWGPGSCDARQTDKGGEWPMAGDAYPGRLDAARRARAGHGPSVSSIGSRPAVSGCRIVGN